MNEQQMQACHELKDYYGSNEYNEPSLSNTQLADLWLEKKELERALRDATIALLKITQPMPPGELIQTITVSSSGWHGWDYAKYIAKSAFRDWDRKPLLVKAVEMEFESGQWKHE